MKKVLVFFAIFFLAAAILTAEDAAKDKSQIVNFQLAAGTGIGASVLSLVVDPDLYFRLRRFERGDTIYLGLDAALRYTPFFDDTFEFPVQLAFAADFKTRSQSLGYIGFWISGGMDMTYGLNCTKMDYYHEPYWVEWESFEKKIRIFPAYSTGAVFVFRSNAIIKAGVYGFYGKFPDIMFVAGYRF